MYICLRALKTSFKAGCRSVIGLDGCHLKSPHGGQLLTAVGVDANNTTWVVAYAQVEMESTDSWKWFLELLVKDLDIEHEGAGWTFISDKQKGLLPAFESIIPLAYHRFCVRHLWTNFTKLFPGKAKKDQLWATAKSTTLAYFHKEMVLIKQMDPKAYDWLTDPRRPPLHWCRAHFKTHIKCDILLNNLCESFNTFILGARGKLVVSSFEEMRVKLMKRIMLRKEKMMKYEVTICPKPRGIFEKKKNKVKAASDCVPHGSGGPQIEVESFGGGKHVVGLERRTCACRRWDLSGIPCKHGVVAINFMKLDLDDFVDDCYLKKTYMANYSHTIKPVNGMELWPTSEEPTILSPPQYTRQPGRPRTARIKDASKRAENGGSKLGRVQRSLRCDNCGVVGHNERSCHMQLPPKPKATNINKRKMNNEEAETSANQGTGKKKATKTKNELRQKARERAEVLKKKRDEKKAATARAAPTNARAAHSANARAVAASTSRDAPASSSKATAAKDHQRGLEKVENRVKAFQISRP
ncbi:uncharacterized protein LOC133737368 [Rosa rugosa]|uniref:uncharacterized protein LOC133737368 n=1 Tax=Rosa rugosa TaxID=74645 RepID=UPI002B4063C8|nr:uncharacterized protein LOC133737368 [Rosa rugosa]